MTIQNNDFADRIARIEAGKNSFRSTVYVGLEESYRTDQLPRITSRKTAKALAPLRMKKAKVKSNQRSHPVIALPAAFAIGVLAMLIWQAVDYQWTGVASQAAGVQQAFAINAATGMALAILLCQTTGLSAPTHILASFAGLVAATFGLGHLVALAPDQFASVFSTGWVTDVLSRPSQASLLFG